MMIGLPGSGKSTYANLLVRETGAVILSTDNIINVLACMKSKSYNQVFSDTIDIATRLYNAYIDYHIYLGSDIILDRTHTTMTSRAKVLPRFKGYNKVAIFMDIDSDLAYERNLDRKDKVISEKVFLQMKAGLLEPNLVEGFDEIYKKRYLLKGVEG